MSSSLGHSWTSCLVCNRCDVSEGEQELLLEDVDCLLSLEVLLPEEVICFFFDFLPQLIQSQAFDCPFVLWQLIFGVLYLLLGLSMVVHFRGVAFDLEVFLQLLCVLLGLEQLSLKVGTLRLLFLLDLKRERLKLLQLSESLLSFYMLFGFSLQIKIHLFEFVVKSGFVGLVGVNRDIVKGVGDAALVDFDLAARQRKPPEYV